MAVNNTKEALTLSGIILSTLLLVGMAPKAFSSQFSGHSLSAMEQLIDNATLATNSNMMAKLQSTHCYVKKEMAKVIMSKYQAGSDFESVYVQVDSEFSKQTILFAWQVPMMDTALEKDLAVTSFGEMVFEECISH